MGARLAPRQEAPQFQLIGMGRFMIYLLWTLAAALAVMLLAPETPITRWLKRTLVEAPSEWLARRKRGQVALWFLLAAFIALCVWAPDVARGAAALFASGADGVPIIVALLDGSVVAEILMAVWLAVNAFKPLWRLIRRSMNAVASLGAGALRSIRRQRDRGPRRPSARKPRKPDDSSSEPGLAFA
jgi:hypothetical protein